MRTIGDIPINRGADRVKIDWIPLRHLHNPVFVSQAYADPAHPSIPSSSRARRRPPHVGLFERRLVTCVMEDEEKIEEELEGRDPLFVLGLRRVHTDAGHYSLAETRCVSRTDSERRSDP